MVTEISYNGSYITINERLDSWLRRETSRRGCRGRGHCFELLLAEYDGGTLLTMSDVLAIHLADRARRHDWHPASFTIGKAEAVRLRELINAHPPHMRLTRPSLMAIWIIMWAQKACSSATQ